VTKKIVDNQYLLKEFSYHLRLLKFASQLPNDGKVKNGRLQICVNPATKNHLASE